MGHIQDITARKRAEEALVHTQNQLRDFAASTSDKFWEMDKQLRFASFGLDEFRQSIVPREQALGKTRWELAGTAPHKDKRWRRHRRELERHLPFRNFEHLIETADGTPRYWRTSGVPIFYEDGVFAGYRGGASDTTERKLAE